MTSHVCLVCVSCACARVLTEKDTLCLGLSQNGLEDPEQGLGQLLLQVVLGVDGNVVLQHEDGVLLMTTQLGMQELTSVRAHEVRETNKGT